MRACRREADDAPGRGALGAAAASVGLGVPARGHPLRIPLATQPNLTTSLVLDLDAPRGARYHVCHVDSPSPDLRDAVMLLTSEIVTRAVRQRRSSDEAVQLRVWMPPDVVRVELHGRSSELFLPQAEGPHYEHSLLDEIADRWSVESDAEDPGIWFEIDRHGSDEESRRS